MSGGVVNAMIAMAAFWVVSLSFCTPLLYQVHVPCHAWGSTMDTMGTGGVCVCTHTRRIFTCWLCTTASHMSEMAPWLTHPVRSIATPLVHRGNSDTPISLATRCGCVWISQWDVNWCYPVCYVYIGVGASPAGLVLAGPLFNELILCAHM